MSKIEEKLDKIAEDVHEIKIEQAKTNAILERNTESLIIHEKRTTASETRIAELEKLSVFIRGAFWVLGLLFLGLQAYLKLASS